MLGAAWINGEFSVIAQHRGGLAGSWISPQPVTEIAGLTGALKAAVVQTGYNGNQVTLLLAHAKLTQRFLEVPAEQNAQSLRALERQVEQGKSFDGSARWVAQPTLPTKTAGGSMVHILPQEFLDQLVSATERAGLSLVCVIPASEGVRNLVHAVPSVNDEVLLFAAALPTSTLMVLVDGGGTPLLVRSAAESWTRDPGRVTLDINRTLLFVQQQFDRTVGSIWLQGADAAEKSAGMAAHFQIPVRPVSSEHDPLFWAASALQFNSKHRLNLITREQKQATSRKVVLKLSAVMAILLLLVAFGLSGYIQYLYGQETDMLVKLRREEELLKKRHTELQSLHETSTHQEFFLKEVGDNRQKPLHAWFLGYLSDSLPIELVVTNVVARADTNGWHFMLHGQVQPALVQLGDRNTEEPLERFTNSLATGPFPLVLQQGAVGTAMSSSIASSSPSDWASRLRGAPPTARSASRLNFFVEGTLP